MQRIIILVIIAILSFSCEKSGYKIDTSIEGIPNGRKVTLKKQVDKKIVNIDSTTVENGKFSFKGELKEPSILGVFIDSIKGGIFPFVGVKDKISIIAYKDSLQKSKVTGSKLNDLITEMRADRDKISKEGELLMTEYQEARKNNDTIAIAKINQQMQGIQDRIFAKDWDFVKNNADSYLSPMILNGLMVNPKYKDSIKIVFNNLSEKIKNSELSKPIREYFKSLEEKKNIPPPPPTTDTPKKIAEPSK